MLHDNYRAQPVFNESTTGAYYELQRRTAN
jgi:hypothetical protein